MASLRLNKVRVKRRAAQLHRITIPMVAEFVKFHRGNDLYAWDWLLTDDTYILQVGFFTPRR